MAAIPGRRRLAKLEFLLLLVGLCLVGYALFSLVDWYVHTQGAATPPNSHKVITSSTTSPDEKPVPQAVYTVPADQPKKVTISSIGVEGFIQQVGEDQHKEIGTPSNVNYAGWFTGSAKPGDRGLSILVGHVDGRYGPALFAKLGSLRRGDALSVQFGDDSVRHFEVVEKRELPKLKTADFLLAKQGQIDNQLNLITCGGRIDKSSRQYTNRVIVVTKRIN